MRKLFFFHCVGDATLTQVVQRGCEVSILEYIQKQSRHGPGQAALSDSS